MGKSGGRVKRMRSSAEKLRGEHGFTLAELMVFVVIMIILMIGIGGMISSGVKSSSASYNLVKMSEGANEALGTMVRQIRVATALDPACSASAITFTGDVNGDGAENVVRFDAAGGYLRRGVAGAMNDWIPGVDSVSFTYYWLDPASKQMTVLTPGSPAWNDNHPYVNRIDISIDMSRSAMGVDLSRAYKSSVTLRNRLGR